MTAPILPEPATTKRRWFRTLFSTDSVVIGGGIALAGFAGFFPWYVFLHQDEFGVRPMTYADSRDLPQWPDRGAAGASPLAIVDNEEAPAAEYDLLSTATIPGLWEEPEPSSEAVLEQPFPDPSPFRLLHVANGRALIENRGGMFIVRIGSMLPDNSRLATLQQRGGSWVIVTSNGEVIAR